jgi:hypothetical protein
MVAGPFTNDVVAAMVQGEKLSWRMISDWLVGMGAIARGAPVPQALANGLAYAHVLNAIEPGLVRLGDKERTSPFLVYSALKQAMLRLNVRACGQNIAECIHWSLAPEWTPKDHLHFCGLLRVLSGHRDIGDSDDDGHYLHDLIEVRGCTGLACALTCTRIWGACAPRCVGPISPRALNARALWRPLRPPSPARHAARA